MDRWLSNVVLRSGKKYFTKHLAILSSTTGRKLHSDAKRNGLEIIVTYVLKGGLETTVVNVHKDGLDLTVVNVMIILDPLDNPIIAWKDGLEKTVVSVLPTLDLMDNVTSV